VLSPARERVAENVAVLEKARTTRSPEAALIAGGDIQRRTRDLDFFGLTGAAGDRLVPAAVRAWRICRGVRVLPCPSGVRGC
jgi:hypothetical protein